MAGGEQSTLNSWGLEFQTVPEPAPVTLAILGVLAGAIRFTLISRQRRMQESPSESGFHQA
jgi:hypothetical protein